jgi:uncharacterized coiled-coil protein SlyX
MKCKVDIDMQVGYIEKELSYTRKSIEYCKDTRNYNPIEVFEEREAYQEAVLETLKDIQAVKKTVEKYYSLNTDQITRDLQDVQSSLKAIQRTQKNLNSRK